jgi:hypothetical protein
MVLIIVSSLSPVGHLFGPSMTSIHWVRSAIIFEIRYAIRSEDNRCSQRPDLGRQDKLVVRSAGCAGNLHLIAT